MNLKILSNSFFHCEKIHVSGKKITSKPQSKPQNMRAKPSGCSFAMVLGVISPKIRTASVITTVETVTPFDSPISPTKNIVASDDATMLTMLLPIRIVVISLS